MPPYHIDPSNEVSLPGVQPPRDPVMTFSAQRYDFRLRPPPAARISLSSRNKQDIETSSVWSQSLGRMSLITSTVESVSIDGGRDFEFNSWASRLDIMRGKVVRYGYVVKQSFFNGVYQISTGIARLLRGCKMNMPR
ncbi:hypothetical protein AGABI1DRAFT_125676 [Agaricus bisporus var. burnettii JB137-S8]|uniref:Uncharacterized protein n=1 Tax=Agaricus bisporus var. burnettii (strain JB137-S8 / ATCC MYA-4627 / FGSC 10392) TaxID=597362 RepID=K5W8L9_AGABU|nr:uncharacterized protein AGABI1DRAFT_125676 [Agaricus bisporus var. burnettii JB137-S8]EKM83204.1 hypothetical protein AGABI1DRAFT_125676 [Agaricus bisporus var. burnettii JB137-S8]